jgi:hypothetical protein
MTFNNTHELVGKSYTFSDGNKIEITQVKKTDEDRGDHLVTYNVTSGPGIPRRYVLPIQEFMNTYSHLFGDEKQ